MDDNTVKLGLTVTLVVALLSGSNISRAETTAPAEIKEELQTSAPAVIGGSVSRSAFTTAVVNREPRGRINELTNDKHHLYFFTELKGMTGQKVTHRWVHKGQTMAEIKFNVGAPRWRVWSSKTLLSHWTGQWKVEVLNEQEQVVYTEDLNYIEAAAPTN
ncbi:DUF2914 domain-containing protein [Pseudomonadota bacterium]